MYDVEILEKSVVGKEKPRICIKGKTISGLYKVLFFEDGRKSKEFDLMINKDGSFSIDDSFDSNAKKIEVYLDNEKVKKLILCVKTNKLKRYINGFFERLFNHICKVLKKIKRSFSILWHNYHFLVPLSLCPRFITSFFKTIKNRFFRDYYHPYIQKDYLKWIAENERFSKFEDLPYKPLISILIPTYNISRKYLLKCLDCILNQTYDNFEVCIADDNSSLPETIDTLKEYEMKDKRVKVVYRKENGHISNATNSALSIADGDYCMLMDDDDEIPKEALFEFVKVLNEKNDLDLIYSDEDKLDMNGNRCEPHLKPDYSPDSLYGGNYLCHLVLMRTDILKEIGGENSKYDGAQDFDLFLRYLERTDRSKVYHISKILYHWRKIPGSTADNIGSKEYAINNGKLAVIDSLKRKNVSADVYAPIKTTQYIIKYKYKSEPSVSILIAFNDNAKKLNRLINSIYKCNYKNFEILIINNNIKKKKFLKLFDRLRNDHSNLQIVNYDGEYNYSKINNFGIKKATGDYILFLNSNVEIVTPDIISSMVSYAMQKHIGCVGVKSLSSSSITLQAGLFLGVGDVAKYSGYNLMSDSCGFYGRLLVPYDYSAVSGDCLMVSKDKLKDVSFLDEKLVNAYQDIDLCMKMLDENLYNIVLPQNEVYCENHKSYGYDDKDVDMEKYGNDLKYIKNKWKEKLNTDSFYNSNFGKKAPFMLNKKDDSSILKKIDKKYNNFINKKPLKYIFNFLPHNFFVLLLFIVTLFMFIPGFFTNDVRLTREEVLNQAYFSSSGIVTDPVIQEINNFEGIDYFSIVNVKFVKLHRKDDSIYKFDLYKNGNVVYTETFKSSTLINDSLHRFNVGTMEVNEDTSYTFVITPIDVNYDNAITAVVSGDYNQLVYTLGTDSSIKLFIDIVMIIFIICFFIINYSINKGYIKSEKSFFLLMLIFIVPIMFIYPALDVPDEAVHFMSAYNISEYDISKTPSENLNKSILSVPDDLVCISYSDPDGRSNLYNYEVYKNCFLNRDNVDFNTDSISPVVTDAKVITYIPSMIGIKIADLFTNSPMIIFYSGRVSAFIVSILLILFAFKIMPRDKRKLLLIVACIPMFIQQIISYNYDNILFPMSLIIISYFIKFIDKNETIKIKDLIIYAIATLFIFLIKAPYAILSLIIVLVPKDRFGNKKLDKIRNIFIAILLFVGLYYILVKINTYGLVASLQESASNPQVSFLMNNPFKVVSIAFNTIVALGKWYYDSMIGNFGWLLISFNELFINAYYVAFILVLLSCCENKLSLKQRIIIMIAILTIIAGVFLALYIYWSEPGSLIVNGVQGRYFIPLIIPIMLCFIPKKTIIKLKNETIYSFISVIFIAYIATLLIAFY